MMPNFVDEEEDEDLVCRLVRLVMLMLSNKHYLFLFLLFGCNGIQNLFDLIEGSLFIWFKDYCFVINMFSYILT